MRYVADCSAFILSAAEKLLEEWQTTVQIGDAYMFADHADAGY